MPFLVRPPSGVADRFTAFRVALPERFEYGLRGADDGRAARDGRARSDDRERRRLAAVRGARDPASARVAHRAPRDRRSDVRALPAERAPPRAGRPAQDRRPLPRGARAPAARNGPAERGRVPVPRRARPRRPRARRSPGTLTLVLAGGVLLVLVGVHEVLELRLLGYLDLDEPALVVGILVDDRGMIVELGVDRGHRPGERRE